jgi:hypothetical protein
VVLDSTGNYLAEISIPGQKLYGIALSTARTTDQNSGIIYITGQSISDPTRGFVSLYQIAMDATGPSNIIRDPAINLQNQPLTTWNLQTGMLHSVTAGCAGNVDLLLLSTSPTSTTTSVLVYEMAAPRPQLQIQPSYPPPVWPCKFVATALMHPFCIGDPVWVAEVAYDKALRSLIFHIVQETFRP